MKGRFRLNPLRDLIQRAAGVPDADLALTDAIMRYDILHSTLDWQIREQLTDAARQAFALLGRNREDCEFSRASASAALCQRRAASATNH